jgi:hypothetical protein
MWQNLEFSISFRAFDWWRLEVSRSWAAAWIIIGPIDIGVQWGA